MKILFALIIALFFSLVSVAFCQPPGGPDIFPDEHTRKLARELDLKTVKEIYIVAGTSREIKVTDPKVIALLVEGLKTAYTTQFSNKVDYLEVTGKNGDALIQYRFSVSHFPELSDELGEGLKAAGAEPEGWTHWKETRKTTERRIEAAKRWIVFALPIALVGSLAFFIFKRRTQVQR